VVTKDDYTIMRLTADASKEEIMILPCWQGWRTLLQLLGNPA